MDVYCPQNKPNTSKPNISLSKTTMMLGKLMLNVAPPMKCGLNFLSKPLQGQKFRDMRAFLQNCPRDYDDDVEFRLLMKPQDVASSWECVDEHAKLKTNRVMPKILHVIPKILLLANHEPRAPHVRLINLKGGWFVFGGSKNSNWTDCTLIERSF
jgi:hypothetical protein